MRRLPRFRRQSGGFSLIELMVALVAGLIVVGAVLAFTVSSVKANGEYVSSARLMQEMRNVGDHISAELRRAGYDESAMDFLASNTLAATSDFAPILVDNATPGANCVIYAYDRLPGDPGVINLDNAEVRAIRRSTATIGTETVGVIEVAESATSAPSCGGAGPDYSEYPVSCNTTSGWCALSDPRVVNIATFTVEDEGEGTRSHGLRNPPGATGFLGVQIRELHVVLEGHLRNSPDLTRKIETNIKVRSDCLRADLGDCELAPAP